MSSYSNNDIESIFMAQEKENVYEKIQSLFNESNLDNGRKTVQFVINCIKKQIKEKDPTHLTTYLKILMKFTEFSETKYVMCLENYHHVLVSCIDCCMQQIDNHLEHGFEKYASLSTWESVVVTSMALINDPQESVDEEIKLMMDSKIVDRVTKESKLYLKPLLTILLRDRYDIFVKRQAAECIIYLIETHPSNRWFLYHTNIDGLKKLMLIKDLANAIRTADDFFLQLSLMEILYRILKWKGFRKRTVLSDILTHFPENTAFQLYKLTRTTTKRFYEQVAELIIEYNDSLPDEDQHVYSFKCEAIRVGTFEGSADYFHIGRKSISFQTQSPDTNGEKDEDQETRLTDIEYNWVDVIKVTLKDQQYGLHMQLKCNLDGFTDVYRPGKDIIFLQTSSRNCVILRALIPRLTEYMKESKRIWSRTRSIIGASQVLQEDPIKSTPPIQRMQDTQNLVSNSEDFQRSEEMIETEDSNMPTSIPNSPESQSNEEILDETSQRFPNNNSMSQPLLSSTSPSRTFQYQSQHFGDDPHSNSQLPHSDYSNSVSPSTSSQKFSRVRKREKIQDFLSVFEKNRTKKKKVATSDSAHYVKDYIKCKIDSFQTRYGEAMKELKLSHQRAMSHLKEQLIVQSSHIDQEVMKFKHSIDIIKSEQNIITEKIEAEKKRHQNETIHLKRRQALESEQLQLELSNLSAQSTLKADAPMNKDNQVLFEKFMDLFQSILS